MFGCVGFWNVWVFGLAFREYPNNSRKTAFLRNVWVLLTLRPKHMFCGWADLLFNPGAIYDLSSDQAHLCGVPLCSSSGTSSRRFANLKFQFYFWSFFISLISVICGLCGSFFFSIVWYLNCCCNQEIICALLSLCANGESTLSSFHLDSNFISDLCCSLYLRRFAAILLGSSSFLFGIGFAAWIGQFI